MQPNKGTTVDVLAIGAGPAGLVGASCLSRYRREVVVIDGGASRAADIPRSRNVPGFPLGISGPQLLQRLRRQAEARGTTITPATIDALRQQPNGQFIASGSGRSWRARAVLLATGTKDAPLSIPLPKTATRRGIVRWCPVCDGYEAIDRRILIVGAPSDGAKHALFVRTYTRDLTLLLPEGTELAADDTASMKQAEVRVVYGTPARTRLKRESGELELKDGTRLPFDVMYPMLGGTPRVQPATQLGANCSDDGRLQADADQQTSIPGLYAAGDAVSSLNQICVAMSEAALAASAIHRRLDSNYR
jgi:thioredoxin reductase (NADPH)